MIVLMTNPFAKPCPRGKPPFMLSFCEQSQGNGKARGKPPYTFSCVYPQRMERARGDPKGIPRDGPLVRSRGDPGE